MSDIQEEIKIAHRKALEQDFNEIIKELKKEEHKNLELSMRINKAIEYINQLQFAFDFDRDVKRFAFDFLYTDKGKELLNILQGKE